MSRKPIALAGVAVFALCTGAAALAQANTHPQPQGPAASAPRPSLLEQVRASGLLPMEGGMPAYYPAGFEARARAVKALMEDATAHLDARLGVKAEATLAVLDKARWDALVTWQPYGVPGVAGRPPVVFMPATDDGVAAQDALAIQPRVDPGVVEALAKLGLSYEQAARRYVDLIALHELGHVYVTRLGIRPNSLWLNELLATYVGYAYMRERRPELAELWSGMLAAYRSAVRPQASSLAEFDRKYFGVGPQTYVWYQAQFQVLAQTVYDARGLGVLAAMQPAFATPSRETADPAAVAARLAPYFPGVVEWMREVGP